MHRLTSQVSAEFVRNLAGLRKIKEELGFFCVFTQEGANMREMP
jgi:hypothetical protein